MPRPKRTSDVQTALTRFNAVRHGLTAEAPVIPGVESAEEWEAHRAAITEDLAPVGAMEAELQAVIEEIDRMRRERLLPDAATLDRIVRHETAMNRMLYQALNQLEAAQARRAGAPAPLHRVQGFGLPGG